MVDYVHGPKLSPGELLVLKHKARSLNCPYKSCDDMDCYRGHHCKFGKRCPLNVCHFSNTHHMDLVRLRSLHPQRLLHADEATEAG